MAYADQKLIGSTLAPYEQEYIVCPICNGGSKAERSMRVTHNGDVILYKCHRASCGIAGANGGYGNLVHTRHTAPKTPAFRMYDGDLLPLCPQDTQWLEAYGFAPWHVSVSRARGCSKEGRIAFPILDPLGNRRGWVFRSFEGGTPKSILHPESDGPMTSWYTEPRRQGDEVWLVEDILSAVRGSMYVDCIALQGTHTTPDAVAEIAALYRNVVWALDADATSTALRCVKQHALNFYSSRTQVLPKDLKDMTEQELKETVYALV